MAAEASHRPGFRFAAFFICVPFKRCGPRLPERLAGFIQTGACASGQLVTRDNFVICHTRNSFLMVLKCHARAETGQARLPRLSVFCLPCDSGRSRVLGDRGTFGATARSGDCEVADAKLLDSKFVRQLESLPPPGRANRVRRLT